LPIEAAKEQQREIRDLRSELRQTRRSLQKIKARMSSAQPAGVAEKVEWAGSPQAVKQ
jgi:hypothetical protein